MATTTKLLGPFSSVWVGITGDNVNPPVQMRTRRKDGGFLIDDIPEIWLPQYKEAVPDGLHSIHVKLTFKQDSLMFQNILYGRALTNTSLTAPHADNHYVFLLMALYTDLQESYLIPALRPIKHREDNREKRTEQINQLNLTWSDDNTYNPLYYEGSQSDLITEMGTLGIVSPF